MTRTDLVAVLVVDVFCVRWFLTGGGGLSEGEGICALGVGVWWHVQSWK